LNRSVEEFRAGQVADIKLESPREGQRFLEAIKSLDDDQIRLNIDEILGLMKTCFDHYYAIESKVADALRRAACRVDSAMFGATEPT
jgi:hypothetical protein